jgi:hypothetical protein
VSLSKEERELVARILADPMSFPPRFRAWVEKITERDTAFPWEDTGDASLAARAGRTRKLVFGDGLTTEEVDVGVLRIDSTGGGGGPPLGDLYADTILGLDPAGFWKLNESSGLTAFDSSGQGNHLVGTVEPGWGQPPGPPGDQTADFSVAAKPRVSRSWNALTGDFTCGLWFNRFAAQATGETDFMGQGQATNGNPGWALGITHEFPNFWRPRCNIRGPGWAHANVYVPPSEWALLAVTKTGSVWRTYYNGSPQPNTYSGSYTSSSGLWIGHNDWSPQNSWAQALLSYAFLYPRALTNSEHALIYNAASPGLTFGKVVVAPYTINPATETIVFATGTGTITLPTSVGRPGWRVVVKRIGSGTITVSAPGFENIDGVGFPGTVSLSVVNAAVELASDGTGWRVLSRYL